MERRAGENPRVDRADLNWGSLLLKKELRGISVNHTRSSRCYAGTPQMVTALANGELEIANLAFRPCRLPSKCKPG